MRKFFSKKDKQVNKSLEDYQIQGLFDKKINVLLDEKLRESEIRYRRLFETAKDGILILNFETGTIIDANSFIIKLLDYPLEKILGKKLWGIGLLSNKEESELAFTELKKKGYIRFENMPIQRQNGKITEVEFVSNVYSVNNEKVIQCNIRDITERNQAKKKLKEKKEKIEEQNEEKERRAAELIIANKELVFQNEEKEKRAKEYSVVNQELIESLNRIQKMNDELISAKVKAEESDTLKSAFMANMSHEIRTPMNAIMGFSEFLLDPGLSKEKLKDFVQIIKASSLQLLMVINDIMDISKIETGQMIINTKLVDINNLLKELFVTYKKLVELKKLSLFCSCDRPNKLIQIETDGNRWKQD